MSTFEPSSYGNRVLLVLGYVLLALALVVALAVFVYCSLRRRVRFSNNHRGNELSANYESEDDNATYVAINSDSEDSDNELNAPVQLAPVLRVDFLFLHGAEEEGCPICLEQFEGSIPLANTPCGHTFHSHCLSQWGPNSCPICRSALV